MHSRLKLTMPANPKIIKSPRASGNEPTVNPFTMDGTPDRLRRRNTVGARSQLHSMHEDRNRIERPEVTEEMKMAAVPGA